MIFGDELTMQYVMTPTTDKILLVPMTYAAITGILLLVHRRVRVRQQATQGALHRLGGLHRRQRAAAHLLLVHHLGHQLLMTWFPMWFSYFLLIVVYPAFLTLFWKLQYKN